MNSLYGQFHTKVSCRSCGSNKWSMTRDGGQFLICDKCGAKRRNPKYNGLFDKNDYYRDRIWGL